MRLRFVRADFGEAAFASVTASLVSGHKAEIGDVEPASRADPASSVTPVYRLLGQDENPHAVVAKEFSRAFRYCVMTTGRNGVKFSPGYTESDIGGGIEIDGPMFHVGHVRKSESKAKAGKRVVYVPDNRAGEVSSVLGKNDAVIDPRSRALSHKPRGFRSAHLMKARP